MKKIQLDNSSRNGPLKRDLRNPGGATFRLKMITFLKLGVN